MVKSYYIYRDSDYYIYGSNIITFIVSTLLHLWLVRITFMVGITYFMVSVTFMIDYYISGWKDSPPFPLQTYVLESVSNDECSFSAAFSSNIWKVFMEDRVWVLIQFHRCLDSREFVFLLNWLRATVSVVPWQVHNSRGAKWVFTSALANDISYLSVNRSKLSDGPVLGLHQIGKKGKRKLVRSSNTVNVRKRIWPNYRHLLQISLCLELKGTFFILLMSSWKIEFIAF